MNTPAPGRPLLQQVWSGVWESMSFGAASVQSRQAFGKHGLTSVPSAAKEGTESATSFLSLNLGFLPSSSPSPLALRRGFPE